MDLGSCETYLISRFSELGNAYSLIKGTYIVILTGLPSLLEVLVGASNVAFPGAEELPAVEVRVRGQLEPSCLHHGDKLTSV